MDSIMDTIVNSLFSFMVTMGTVPIIRCPRGNAAEMVAEVCKQLLPPPLLIRRAEVVTLKQLSGTCKIITLLIQDVLGTHVQ